MGHVRKKVSGNTSRRHPFFPRSNPLLCSSSRSLHSSWCLAHRALMEVSSSRDGLARYRSNSSNKRTMPPLPGCSGSGPRSGRTDRSPRCVRERATVSFETTDMRERWEHCQSRHTSSSIATEQEQRGIRGGTHAKMRMRTIDTKTLDSYKYARTHCSPVKRHSKQDQDQHQILSPESQTDRAEPDRLVKQWGLTASPTIPIAYPAANPVIPHANPAPRWTNPPNRE